MKSSVAGRVLVVDEDWASLEALAQALREKGHSVSLATDGRTGLTRAAEVRAEVVLVDEALPVLDLRTFFDVIREDPRTSGAHLFVMGRGDPARLASLDARAEPVVKPFHAGEVAARIDDLLRAAHAPAEERELRGDLDQVALFDLLQVFAANARTGRLVLAQGDTDASIWVERGDVVDATAGGVSGEKALYRALAVTEGQFVFTPTEHVGKRRIQSSVSGLLMEAARRADEVERLAPSLPSRRALLRRSLDLRPEEAVAAEVMALLVEDRSVQELLDHAVAHDLEVLRALLRLIEEGAVEVLGIQVEEIDLCREDEALMLGAAAAELRRSGLKGVIRVGVIAEAREQIAAFCRALSAIRQFRPAVDPPAPAGSSVFGALGTLSIGGARLELFALPPDDSSLPMIAAFMAPSRAVMVLSSRAVSKNLVALLSDLDLRLVVAEPGWERPEGAAANLRGLLRA
ncbi:MAG: response regulator [Deltaproteobacteria bacterium]|nr:response regulator [Deltaproteobacteria bacterium]